MAEACDSNTGEKVIEQWAEEILEFSSQYDSDPNQWAAAAVRGPPRVYPEHGDVKGVWSPRDKSDKEFIVMKYEQALYLNDIHIYETYNSGAVTKVSAKDEEGKWQVLYQAEAICMKHSRLFKVGVKPTNFKSDTIRLDLNCTVAQECCNIDAVKMIGVVDRFDPPPPMTHLSDDMAKLVNSDEYSDITFIVEDIEVKAHRNILSARSDYFRGMFRHEPMEDGKIQLHDISYDGFIVMLQFLYTNKILGTPAPSPIVLAEVIRAAEMYTMKDLEQYAKYELRKIICVDNVVDIYREASQKTPPLPKVEEVCLEYIAHNFGKVVKTPAFCKLEQEPMLTIVQVCAEKLNI